MTALAAEYPSYDAIGLADLMARREISAEELLAAVQERIEAINPRINAFSQLFVERARAQLREGIAAGPLHGVPFALKDLTLQLVGTATTGGSRLLRDHVASFDSTLVTRYKHAGLLIVGKTTSPEQGLTFTTESSACGNTANPWDPSRTSGGSSGGSAAAVAARVLPAAHASDGGGSIRVPASCCGVFGLKPTRGRVPLGPAQFEGWGGLSTHHVVSISVRDSAALLDAAAGPEPGTPFLSARPDRPFLDETSVDPGRLRMALALDAPGGVPLDPECRRAAVEAAALCEDLGHVVEDRALPVDVDRLRDAFATIVNVSVARTLDDAAALRARPVSEDEVEPITWYLAERGRRVTATAYAAAIAATHQIGLGLATFLNHFDVILSPTLAQQPVPLGVLSLSSRDPRAFGRAIREFSPYTGLYNVTGQPSMSVPLHWTAAGIPIGVMFSGRFGGEAMLFRLAGQLERARPWAHRKPVVD